MTAEWSCSISGSHVRGYVDAVETLNDGADVSPTCSVGRDEMLYGTPPTSPTFADGQDEKSQNSQFTIVSTTDADNTGK